ncbi:hypothetical protein B9Z55_008568 [Caenorhabditis nigoni]|uniref:PPM-type phosphatase domain-containing protein n=1 Tax=Caenorhabditis nigoni TaxID=1611254 RepID=A0A2G5UN36_9PELO|nr:hypothetical protein B9Z55_008568 [Caenorhabditis nigoni]
MVQTDEPEARTPLQFGENLRITAAANQGGRRYMEDRCVIHTERDDKGILLWTFVGVYDGHGGEHASEYVRKHLLMNITKNQKFASDNDEDILEAIRQGFLFTHEQMRDVHLHWPYTASGFPSTAGTTVSCVFIRNGKLYTGHVGDSAIYLGTVENGDVRSCPLTIDHKPESAHEQMRIAKAGGETAVKSGVTRVVWKRPARVNMFTPKDLTRPIIMDKIPFLSVARSLGDLWSYNKETNMFVVSPEPDLGVHRLTGNDFCLVLASDGMTNVLTGEQAVEIVFKEEELVEIHDEINRNHSRCVLRTALHKWRSLRADNVTVATVIFDIDPLQYSKEEVVMKVGRYVNVSQVLTDRPDALLKISKTDSVLLTTTRTPIIYNGTKDANFCKVNYRGPGFRSHDEEVQEERTFLINKFNTKGAKIGISNGSADSKRGPSMAGSSADLDYDDEDDDEDDEDDEEEDEPFDPSETISIELTSSEEKTVTVVPSAQRPPRPHAPLPVFIDDSIIEPENSENGVQSTSSGVKRVKAEAVRRLRTPRIEDSEDVLTEKRVTRSASRSGVLPPPSEGVILQKTPSPIKSVIGINMNPSPDARLPTTPRRSSRLLNACGGIITPGSPGTTKLTMSRKRARTAEEMPMMMMSTGVTPVVSGLSLQESPYSSLIPSLVQPNLSERLRQMPLTFPVFPPNSRSEPSTPKKPSVKPSKWSLSQLDDKKKKNDGIVRVSEVADDDEEGLEDVMREPPSKMRRFVGYMKKMFWGK